MLTALALIVIALGAVLAYTATRSDSLHVQRAARIMSPPEKIFPLINDFHNWSVWSPYDKLDPAMKRVFSGAPSGKGAVYEWEGNSKAGKGRMEITDASHPSRITIKLDFIKPFEGHNTAEFTLVPEGDATNVTWAMNGPTPFVARVMSVFVNMDTMIGKDFATGLANLKTVAER